MNNKLNSKLILFLIIILGISLRYYDLDRENVWLDEGYAVLESNQDNLSDTINQVRIYESSPPFYIIILHYWTKIFGISEFSLRFPSLLASVISIYLVYLFSNYVFNKKTAILSSLLFSTSLIPILYSQEARPYSIFCLLVLLSSYYFLKLLKEGYNLKNNIFYILSSVLMIYTHYIGLFLLIFQNIFFMYKLELNLKEWIKLQVGIVLLYSLWIHDFFLAFIHIFLRVKNIVINKFQVSGILFNLFFIVVFLFFLFLCSVLLSFYYKRKRINFSIDQKLSIILILVYVSLSFLYIKILASPIFLTRYAFFIFPFMIIFFSDRINKIKNKVFMISLISLILILNIFSLTYYYTNTTKEPWRDVANLISANSNEKDIILIDNGETQIPFNYYYNGNLEILGLGRGLQTNNNMAKDISFENLKNKLSRYEGVWLILSHAYGSKDYYKSNLDNNYRLKIQKNYKDINLYYYSLEGV